MGLFLGPDLSHQVAQGQVDIAEMEVPGGTQRLGDPGSPIGCRALVVDLEPGGSTVSLATGAAAAVECELSHRLGNETLPQLRRALEGFADNGSARRSAAARRDP